MEVSGAVNDIVNRSKANINREAGDYEVNGLLHCGKCHTPKQGRYQMPWGEVMPYILCQCERERNEKEEQEREQRKFAERVKRMRRDCFKSGKDGSKMQFWTFETDKGYNPTITTASQNYVKNFDKMLGDGKGLLFFGEVGRGKTFASVCIANALIDKGYPCFVTNFSTLTNTISGLYEKQAYIDSLNQYALLVIDDLASERNSEFMNEIVYNVIDSRYRSGLPLIITTNLTGDEIKNPAEISKERIFSRLLEMCIPIEVKGKDRRKENLKDTFGEYKELLGL